MADDNAVGRLRQLAVYEAEEAALAGCGRVFRGPAEAQRYVETLTDSDWWADRWPQVERIVVGRSRSRRLAGYARPGAAEVRLAVWHEAVLLHELAHVVGPGDEHDNAFVAALLALVRRQMGFHAYGALLGELRARGLAGPARTGRSGTADQ